VKTDVLILGGGLAGLACAVSLRESGLKVIVVEREAFLGGRAASVQDAHTGDTVDIGPHIFISEYRNLLSLLRTFRTHHRIAWQTDRLITLLNRGRTSVMRTHRLPPPLHLFPSLLKTRDVSLCDKVSNLAAIWTAMKSTEADVPQLDRRNAYDLLVELGVSERFMDWFWRSASMSLMNVPLEECSAGALMRFYTQLLGHHDLRIGFPSTGLSELFLPMAEEAIQQAGGTVLKGDAAHSVIGTDDRCESIVLCSGSRISARYFVAALPAAALAALVPTHWVGRREFASLDVFQPSPYISVYLWLDRKLTDRQFWAQVWSPTTFNYDFYDLSNIRSAWSDRPSTIASNIIYSRRCEQLSDEEIVRITLGELAALNNNVSQAKLIHSRVHRIPMAIPCPYVETERARPATSTSIKNFFLAGDWTRTHLPASMESAVRSGFLAAEAIWGEIGRPRVLAQMPKPMSGLTGWMQRQALRSRGKAIVDL
jgi:squalene-associated FAD-dependent desaturase